ncbi:MAG: phosphatase PAP2 family protein [Planctomycetota bacterium]|jgi:hypothetical protein|nr:phosphatase PAP2 family protein [Planctomycetota bacterium]
MTLVDPPWLQRPWRIWATLWRDREAAQGRLFPWAIFLIVGAISAGGYGLTVQLNAWRAITVWDPSTPWDFSIPVVPWSILPYLSLYFYFPMALLSVPRTDRGRFELLILHQGLLLLSLISFAFFLAFPCEIQVTAQVPAELIGAEEFPGPLFAAVRYFDRPYNAWPSLHISLSFLVLLFLVRRWERPLAVTALVISWVLLALSILTTKQHYIFDLATGLALALGVWNFSLGPALNLATRHETDAPEFAHRLLTEEAPSRSR